MQPGDTRMIISTDESNNDETAPIAEVVDVTVLPIPMMNELMVLNEHDSE